MTIKNQHEHSSCPVDQDVLEESTEEILDEGYQNSDNGFSQFNFSEPDCLEAVQDSDLQARAISNSLIRHFEL